MSPDDAVRPPRPDHLLARIQSLAQESSSVVFTNHAHDRMSERDILDIDVFRVLRNGTLKGEVEAGRRTGDWKVKVVYRVRGSRDVGAVVVVTQAQRLVIVTVEWEDLS